MLIWCVTLFGLGVLAFLDSLFSYGDIFRTVNSILFMLLSLGLLIRTRVLMKLKRIENLESRNNELEKQLVQFTQTRAPKEREQQKVL